MKTPQQKKRESYTKDRRNMYGENDKGSRKNIPRRRARTHRKYRHAVRQVLVSTDVEIVQDRAEEVSRDVFDKMPDVPLGAALRGKQRVYPRKKKNHL